MFKFFQNYSAFGIVLEEWAFNKLFRVRNSFPDFVSLKLLHKRDSFFDCLKGLYDLSW